jgi:hypothetical protein
LTSSFAPGFAATEVTTAFPLDAGMVTTSHARGASTAANTLGRVVAQNTGPELVSVAIALPASHGRATVNESPCAESAVTSLKIVLSSSAATRGATSLPVAVAAAKNPFAPLSCTTLAMSRASPSGLYGAPPTSATAFDAPFLPSAAAARSAPSPLVTAITP